MSGTMKMSGEISKYTGIPILPINYDLYKPRAWGKYIEIGDELKILEGAIKAGLPFLFEGEKGLGKTMAVHTTCVRNDIPIVEHSCSSGTTMGDILGREHLIGDSSVFRLGVLPTAIEVANHFGKGILYLDEVNALEPEIQKMMNPVIDDRRNILVAGNRYQLDEGVQFNIVASMNPSHYGGTNPLNEDLRSRFIGMVWEYPSAPQINKVIDWTGVPEKVQKAMLQMAIDTLAMKKGAKVEYVISVRDIALFVKAYNLWKQVLGEDKALRTAIETAILIKFADPTEREIMRERASETFAENMK